MNNGNNIIEVNGLVKKFGSFVANDHLTFSVKRGEIFGFLGANGAGKTTAIKILCGLSTPTSGEVKVAGYDIYKNREEIKKTIGYMSQKFSLYNDLTIRENIRFYAGIYGMSRTKIKEKTEEVVKAMEIEEISDILIKDIPLGWKQKLAFTLAVFHEPQIVFLDEPTSGVDPITRRQFWDMIYEETQKGTTVFVTTHYMDEAENCHRVCILSEGNIVALGTPNELKKEYNAENMGEVFVKTAKNIYA
ncbi:MAG: ABC transporter ATP-binding protein [Bacteroidales bacterium]|nr:ABC transporter ATP-binding protein [Bacteroidales bacterium]